MARGARASASPRFEGIWAALGPEDAPVESAARLARLLQRSLGAGWRRVPAGRDTREFHFLYRGRKRFSPAAAWNLANEVRKAREVRDAGPLFVVEGFPEAPPREPAPSRRAAARAARPLACSAERVWALETCKFPRAWTLTLPPGGKARGEGIVVGHPDTGYTNHPQLVAGGRVLIENGFDFLDDDADAADPLTGPSASHGTSTGSVIVSEEDGTDGGGPLTGAAPAANLLPLRVTDFVGLFSYGTLSRAIRFAADNGAHVLSISLGGAWSDRSLLRALQYAEQRGVIVVAASGNYVPIVVYPARYEECVATCATNCADEIWRGASAGDDVDVSAPGESVWRARMAGAPVVERGDGTSYATALVAGAAACWLAYHGRDALAARYGLANVPSLFKELLMQDGVRTPSGWDRSLHGAGILDAAALLAAPLPLAPRAAGMRRLRARGPVRRPSPIEVVASHLPPVEPAALRPRLARALGTDDAGLDAALAEHLDELTFHVATNRALRERLLAAPGRARRGAASRRPAPRFASRDLRRTLQMAGRPR